MKKYLYLLLLFILPHFLNAQTYTNNTGGPIPDNDTLTFFPVTVSGLPSVIDTNFGLISFCIDIAHTFDADLRIYLKSPNNIMVELSSTNGGSGNNYSGTCFKMDGLSGYIVNGSAPFIGTYIPEQSLNLFNTGINPDSTWFLCVLDEVPNDSGNVISFTLNFGTNPPPDPTLPAGPCSVTDASGCACPLPGVTDCDLLPDMTASSVEIQNGYYEYQGYIDMNNATPNIGYGPLEIRGINQCYCDTMLVPCSISMCPDSTGPKELIDQRIYHKNSNGLMTFYDIPGGTMTYHPSHGHIHVDDWASYTLRVSTPDPDPRNWPIVGLGTKTSYCLVNLGDCNNGAGICVDTNGTVYDQSNLLNYGLGNVSGCGTEQGIFVGSYDVYSAGLDGQRIYIPGICNDDYYIVSITDPDNHFKEMNENNNWVSVPVTLSQQPGIPPMSTFLYSAFGATVGFFNYATGSNTYYWDFGDGTVDSSGQLVTHVFAQAGSYVVVLTIDNGTCRSTSAQIITIQSQASVNENTISFSGLSVTPNPSCGDVRISFQVGAKSYINATLFDSYGKKIKQFTNGMSLAGKYEYTIRKEDLAAGLYFIRVSSDNHLESARFVVFNQAK